MEEEPCNGLFNISLNHFFENDKRKTKNYGMPREVAELYFRIYNLVEVLLHKAILCNVATEQHCLVLTLPV